MALMLFFAFLGSYMVSVSEKACKYALSVYLLGSALAVQVRFNRKPLTSRILLLLLHDHERHHGSPLGGYVQPLRPVAVGV